jgi:alpha-tubulin suppressor-like RCC1 family protein
MHKHKKIIGRAGFALVVIGMAILPLQQVFATIASPQIGSTVFGTGFNRNGQIGNGEGIFQTSVGEFLLPAGLTVKSSVHTSSDTWVIASDDQVYGAGYNLKGELGDGTTTMRTIPVRFQLPAGLSAVSLTTQTDGNDPYDTGIHVLASDGNVYSAGDYTHGQLGVGAVSDHVSTPTAFQLPAGVTALEVKTIHLGMYVRASDGNVYAAGWNQYGQMGNGTSGTDQAAPGVLQLPAGLTVKKLIVPDNYYTYTVYVITNNDQIYAAGADYGKFGAGATSISPTPVNFPLPAGVTPAKVIPDNYITAVIASDGNLYNSGSNYDGQLGDGTTTNSTTPVIYQLPAGVTAVDSFTPLNAGPHQVLGSDGMLYSSGYNDYGRFGTGSASADDTQLTPTPFILPAGVTVVKVAVEYNETFVIASDNKVYAAGENLVGQFGIGTTGQQDTPVVATLPAGVVPADLYLVNYVPATSSYKSVTYVRSTTGALYAVGDNSLGLLGNGTRTNSMVFAPVQLPSGVTAQKVDARSDNWTANILGSDNKLYSIGKNSYGQTGTGGQTMFALDPAKFILPDGVMPVKVYVNNNYTMVLGSDSQLYGAGYNGYGQLGDGTFTDRYTPVRFQLPAGLTVVDVGFPSSAGTAVLASDGQVYSAGENSYGTLGNGVTTSVATPAKFQLPAGVTAVSLSDSYGGVSGGGIAIDMSVRGSDGQVYTAGANGSGQLGNGTSGYTPVSTPVQFQLPAGVTAKKVYNLTSLTVVIASDDQVYVAGYNYYGQVGNGTMTGSTPVSTPTRFALPAGLTAVSVDGSPDNIYVLASDGQLYGAGRNSAGQLGDGTLTNTATPVKFQLPAGLTVRSASDIVSSYSAYGSWMTVVASDNQAYSAGAGGDGASLWWFGAGPLASIEQPVPIKYQLPAGLTANKIVVSFNRGYRISIIASNGQLYQTGDNTYGELGDGTTNFADYPVRFQLPAGLTALDARPESSATIVLASNGRLYVAGHDTSGWLGDGTKSDKSSVVEYNLPADMQVGQFAAILGWNMVALSTPLNANAVGSQVYCDGNGNGTQDSGESMVNGQTVSIYHAVGGVVSGPAIATQQTSTYQAYDGTFFFDGLAPGEYIVGLTTDDGILYSQPTTLTSNGDGWILGNSQYINSTSAMGQTGFVCGASIVAPPPAGDTPTTLAPTGAKIGAVASMAIGLILIALAVVFGRRTTEVVTSAVHKGVEDVTEIMEQLHGKHVTNSLAADFVPYGAYMWAELSRMGYVDVSLDGVVVSRQ